VWHCTGISSSRPRTLYRGAQGSTPQNSQIGGVKVPADFPDVAPGLCQSLAKGAFCVDVAVWRVHRYAALIWPPVGPPSVQRRRLLHHAPGASDDASDAIPRRMHRQCQVLKSARRPAEGRIRLPDLMRAAHADNAIRTVPIIDDFWHNQLALHTIAHPLPRLKSRLYSAEVP
jgi:hypothetical protein